MAQVQLKPRLNQQPVFMKTVFKAKEVALNPKATSKFPYSWIFFTYHF